LPNAVAAEEEVVAADPEAAVAGVSEAAAAVSEVEPAIAAGQSEALPGSVAPVAMASQASEVAMQDMAMAA
jgi:hypothetical protein